MQANVRICINRIHAGMEQGIKAGMKQGETNWDQEELGSNPHCCSLAMPLAKLIEMMDGHNDANLSQPHRVSCEGKGHCGS